MSSSSGSLDLSPDRVSAREEHYTCHRLVTPSAKCSVDLADLGGIGAHIPLPSEQSYPETVDLPDDEDSSPPNPILAPAPVGNSLYQGTNSIGTNLDIDPPTRISTPSTACDVFLPTPEFREFMRHRRSDRTLRKRSRNSSEGSPTRLPLPNRAIEYRTRRGEIPEYDHHEETSFSVSDTAPSCSEYTVEGKDHAVEYEPNLDDPWSPAGPLFSPCTPQARES